MKYLLAEACQNRFVLFDCSDLSLLSEDFLKQVHTCLAREKADDALILIDKKMEGERLYVQMIVLGLDGSFGEFCGNGARACAAYLFERYPQCKQFFLMTKWGTHELKKLKEGHYAVRLPPARFELNTRFMMRPLEGFHYVEVIEPHLIFQGEVSDEELLSIGRALNRDKELFPLGINVSAWSIHAHNLLYVMTYERGVQRLTKSCGTGSMACASFYSSEGNVSVQTPGGFLEIEICKDDVELKGPAQICSK